MAIMAMTTSSSISGEAVERRYGQAEFTFSHSLPLDRLSKPDSHIEVA
jgi:hypothetical protein